MLFSPTLKINQVYKGAVILHLQKKADCICIQPEYKAISQM